jgi:hypothetical protein
MTKRKHSGGGGKPLPIGNLYNKFQPHDLANLSPEMRQYVIKNSRELNAAAQRPYRNWSSPRSWLLSPEEMKNNALLREQALNKFGEEYNAAYARELRARCASLPPET